MTRCVLALLLGGLTAAAAPGVSPDPKDLAVPPQELSKARELVRKLGSEVYREREEAYAELVKMGRLARPALLEAVASDPDPEIRFRSSRLLPKAGADELKARLETFLADAEGKYEHDLPGLKQYRKIAGQDEKARTLFVDMVKSPYNVELLQALDRGATDGGRAIADRRGMLYGHLQQKVVNGRIVPPQPISLEDIACLLFAETAVPGKEVPRNGMWSYVTGATFLQQQSSNNAINNAQAPHAEAYRRIVGRWIETRDDPQDLNNQLAYLAGQQLRSFPESVPLLRRIVATEGVHGYNKGQALMYLVQRNGKAEVDFLKKQLGNDTLVTTVWFGNVNPNQQPQQHQCLLRDVALAMLVTQTDQKMTDYGFKFPPGTPVPNAGTIGYGNYAFETDEARHAAMTKFGFWQLKQSFKPPAKDEPKKEEAKPEPPGPVKP
jgi:hypothetical protein